MVLGLYLSFPNQKEETAIVRHSLRKGGETNSKTANPSISYWNTPNGKEGSIFLKLHEETGIELHSRKPLVLKADQDIHFMQQQRLTMNEGKSIHFTCDASSLLLDGITDIQGAIVYMEGSNKALVSVASASEEDEEDFDELQLGLDVGGMIPLAGSADG